MASLPCLNPSCKSEGKPHPNCKCYVGMAEGGEPEHFCSKEREHKPDCEHFLDGPKKAIDPTHQVAAFLINQGIHGALKLNEKPDLMHYDKSVMRGHKESKNRIEALFEGKDYPKPDDHSKAKKSIHEWLEKGGITHDVQKEIYKMHEPQGFAEGGEVKQGVTLGHPLETERPEQNILLNTAKGRVSQYLNGLRPLANEPRLAFDPKPDQTKKKKVYDSALDTAVHPLHILDKINQGTIDQQHVQHFKSMYPEVDNYLQRKLTDKITEDQLEDKRPSHKVRQGLSLFMGTPLSAELKPQNIMAAQATFQATGNGNQGNMPGSPGQPPSSGKKGKSSKSALSKSDQAFLTPNQALAERQQSQH